MQLTVVSVGTQLLRQTGAEGGEHIRLPVKDSGPYKRVAANLKLPATPTLIRQSYCIKPPSSADCGNLRKTKKSQKSGIDAVKCRHGSKSRDVGRVSLRDLGRLLARRPALTGSTPKLPNAAHSLPSARQFVLSYTPLFMAYPVG